jgi:predicted RNase H-like HicB family nuclease
MVVALIWLLSRATEPLLWAHTALPAAIEMAALDPDWESAESGTERGRNLRLRHPSNRFQRSMDFITDNELTASVERADPGRVAHSTRYHDTMRNEFTAIVERDGSWHIAYCAELPGANGQGASREECRGNLRAAISLVLEHRREESLRSLPPRRSRSSSSLDE